MKSNTFGLDVECQEKIVELLDSVMDEYLANHKIVFGSESNRSKLHHGHIKKHLQDWQHSKQCIVPSCTEKSIQSHTISKGMLNSLSEEGHVLTPFFDQNTGQLALKPIGIKTASVFPGFCLCHEKLFESFEVRKQIKTNEDIQLQTYRAICREKFRTDLLLKQSRSLMEDYIKHRDNGLLNLIKNQALENYLMKDIDLKSISIKNDPISEKLEKHISSLQLFATHIEKFLYTMEKSLFKDEDKIYINAVDVDFNVPVALSGCSNFFIEKNGIKKEIVLVFNVIPNVDHTLIILAGLLDDKSYIDHYISIWSFKNNFFSFLSMIESWMVNGSDQWYLKPSAWDFVPENRKKEILTDILACKQNISQEYKFSIFDDLRIKFLTMLKNEKSQDDYKEIVESQKIKMEGNHLYQVLLS